MGWIGIATASAARPTAAGLNPVNCRPKALDLGVHPARPCRIAASDAGVSRGRYLRTLSIVSKVQRDAEVVAAELLHREL
jgi:hypothetical protein